MQPFIFTRQGHPTTDNILREFFFFFFEYLEGSNFDDKNIYNICINIWKVRLTFGEKKNCNISLGFSLHLYGYLFTISIGDLTLFNSWRQHGRSCMMVLNTH